MRRVSRLRCYSVMDVACAKQICDQVLLFRSDAPSRTALRAAASLPRWPWLGCLICLRRWTGPAPSRGFSSGTSDGGRATLMISFTQTGR